MKKFIFTISILTLGLTNCTKSDDCKSNIVCTEEFRSIDVNITSSNAQFSHDSYKTTRVSDGKEVYNKENSIWENPTILDDSGLKETTLKGETFLFEGYKNGAKVISEEYVIKHDCCHIIKISGKDSITL